ncbi:MAG TPA: AI-2E family transporter [Bacteroidia bacterium]|jgi:predicted PurR-regulated permease PerM|nr:AI-2E family transporter [Bacteroidia bacterium]
MKKYPFTIKLASWLVIAVLGTIILIYTKDFLLPIVIAGLISMLLYPVYKKLKRWKLPNALTVVITMMIVVVVLVSVILLVSRELTSMMADAGGLSGKINNKFSALQVYVAGHFETEGTINNFIANAKNKLLDYTGVLVSGTIAGTTNIMSTLVLIIVYIFCFLFYNRAFKTFAFALLADETQSQASGLIHDIQKLVQNYLLGLLMVILIIGTLNSVGLVIIGVDHPMFFAFLTAMLTVIPYIGITIGALITATYTLLTKDTVFPAVAVMAVMFSIQILESNLITPRIVGSRVSVNPFVAIVALLIGGQIWGIPGMIVAVPLVAILKVIFDLYPSTQALGYFIGNELTDKTNDPKTHLHPINTNQEDKPED